MHVSIGQAAQIIGVSISTLRRWEKEQRFSPCFKAPGGHRRYSLKRIDNDILDLPNNSCSDNRITIAYARVSSHDQKMDLLRQEKRLSKYCDDKSWKYEVISDLGSGLNYKKRGLVKLISLICNRQVSRLVLTHKDRLLRFGSPLLFKLCNFFNTEVVIIEDKQDKTFEQELVADVIEIMTVFTAKMYGRRSHSNRKQLLCAS